MDEQLLNLSEKKVQCLIADYPWLLNLDYEVVPELRNKGMEYQLTESKRCDLILRDRNSGRPVIIEFKSIPFYRENIGQILEYKARIIQEYTNDNSILKNVFEDKMFVPIMVLVVPSCTSESRLACNLSSIEVYEYNNKSVAEILIPEKQKTLDELINVFKGDNFPFSADRADTVDGVYNQIYELLLDENLAYGWKKYKPASGEYFVNLNHLFINKEIFKDYDVSIGIVENIFSDSNYNEMVIEYYSNNIDSLNKFIAEYRRLELTPNNNTNIDEEMHEGVCWGFCVDKEEFLKNTKDTVKPFILNYINVMKSLKMIE